jgi:hypothetical protein
MKWRFSVLLGAVYLILCLKIQAQSQKPVQLPPSKPKELAKILPNPLHERKKLILKVLEKQTEDWNKGNLTEFLDGYWKSDTLRMVTNRGVTYGFEKIAATWKKNFPDSTFMGKLDYDVIHVELIGETDAMVTGKWLLKVEKKFKGGYFTFLIRKLKGRWVIVADHTS